MPTGRGPLRIAIEDFLSTFGFGKRISEWLRGLLETFETEAIDAYQKITDAAGITDKLPEIVRPDSLRAKITHQIELVALVFPIIWGLIGSLTNEIVEPFTREFGYLMNALARSQHPDPETLARMLYRSPDLADKLKNYIPGTGLSEESWKALTDLSKLYLTTFEYESLRLRGKMTTEEVHAKLLKMGLNEDDLAGMDELAHVILPITDLIHIADRFGFDDTLAEKYRRDEEYPKDKVEPLVTAQGLDAESFKLMWRAHWQDPPIQQIFEMYHRLRPEKSGATFDDAELQSYLQVVPLSPYWWDKLKAIAYQPITTRYVRELYNANVIDKDKVLSLYKDNGFDDEYAKIMTDWTTANAKTTQKGASQAAILSAYKDGLYSKDQTTSALLALNYTQDDVDFYISLADYEIKNQQDKIEIDIAREKYIRGVTDEVGLAKDLGALNLPSDRMTALEELWNVQRNNKIAVVSRSELDDLITRGIISVDEYTSELTKIGYSDQENNWLVIRITHILKDNAAVELAKQQTEQERLAVSTLKTQYQVDHQNIVVAVAQYKSAIADLQYDAATTSDPNQKAQDEQQIALYKNAVVHLNEQAATIKQTLVTNLQATTTKSPTTGG